MVSKEDVRSAYSELLGRDAENEEVVAKWAADFSSVDAMRGAIIGSSEYQARLAGRTIPVPTLPVVPMSEVCRFGLPIRLLEPDVADGNVTFVELVVLNHLVAERSPKVVFELGTFDGRTTLNLAANAPDDGIVYTLDLPGAQIDKAGLDLEYHDRKYIEKAASGTRFADKREAARIEQLFGDTAQFDFGRWHGKVDLVFVDASHSAPYVRNDTEVAMRLIGSRPGLIVWHDYNAWDGVTVVLNEYQRNDPRFIDLKHIADTSLAFCPIPAKVC